MSRVSASRLRAVVALVLASAALAGCAQKVGVTRVRLSERECLARAMYFESNRSSDAGMLAVGTVVINRVKSGRYGSSVCEVVGAPRQFAPGVLSRPMADRGAPRARRIADAVLSGWRHPGVQNAQFFHTAGYKFPYNNMRYVLVAGGNAFYDKTKAPKNWYGGEGRWGPPPAPSERIDGGPVMVADVELTPDAEPVRRRSGPAIAETRVVETRVAVASPPRGGVSGGIPIYEPAPSSRASRETVVATLEPEARPRSRYEPVSENRRAAIREDNGLREEDRWRDQELAEDAGRRPASAEDWSERRDRSIESAPLPVIEAAPEPRTPRSRVASRRADDYVAPEPEYVAPEPQPSRNVRVASRRAPVEADPAAMGWRAGPAPVRMGSDDESVDDYRPLSNAAAEDGYQVDAPRSSRPTASRTTARRSYGGVELGEVGYR